MCSRVQSHRSAKYKLQGEHLCIKYKIMLGNFEIKFKVVFCYKLKSYFVLLVVAHHLLEQCPKDSLPQGWRMIEVVRGGGDGQMFSKESFKANILVQLSG